MAYYKKNKRFKKARKFSGYRVNAYNGERGGIRL